MKLIVQSLVLSSLLLTSVSAKDETEAKKAETKVEKSVKNESDVTIFTADNKGGKITPKSIQAVFEKAGFFVSANRDMNTPFKKQFKETSYDVYNLFTFYKKDVALELAKKYENIGLFAPMSMSIYTKKGGKSISVSTLSVEALSKIMKIPTDDKLLKDLRALVVKTIHKALPNGKFEKLAYTPVKAKGDLVTTFSMEMDKDEWEDELEDFKMDFEGQLATNGFIIAGKNNLGDDFDEANYNGYDFYEVYSICKLPVIYTIAKTHPEAGAFAPCSLYLEKKKDVNSMEIAFPSVYNWISSMALDNKEDIKVLQDAQDRMSKILKGATE
jgi:uncharacterized protein (DUF302 family)